MSKWFQVVVTTKLTVSTMNNQHAGAAIGAGIKAIMLIIHADTVNFVATTTLNHFDANPVLGPCYPKVIARFFLPAIRPGTRLYNKRSIYQENVALKSQLWGLLTLAQLLLPSGK